MEWAWIAGGVIALSLLTLALGASIAVVRSAAMQARQKPARLALIWLLPLVGPMLVLHRIQRTEPEVIPREIVAGSGLGWGLLGDSAAARRLGRGSGERCRGRKDGAKGGDR